MFGATFQQIRQWKAIPIVWESKWMNQFCQWANHTLIQLAPSGLTGPPPLTPAPQLSGLEELHLEFSRPSLNRNVQNPFVWWWIITQPRPIWKKAPAGLQRPSHTDCHIPGVLYSPKLPVPHLGPDPRYPWGLVPPYDSIIKKGFRVVRCQSINCNKPDLKFIQRGMVLVWSRQVSIRRHQQNPLQTSTQHTVWNNEGPSGVTACIGLFWHAGISQQSLYSSIVYIGLVRTVALLLTAAIWLTKGCSSEKYPITKELTGHVKRLLLFIFWQIFKFLDAF